MMLALRDVVPNLIPLLVIASFGLIILGGLHVATRSNFVLPVRIEPKFVPLLAFFAISAISIIHAAARGVVPANSLVGASVVMVAAWSIAALLMFARVARGRMVAMAVDAIALVLLASTILYALGIEPSARWVAEGRTGEANVLARLGIYVPRTVMPLTLGPTSHAALCGLVIVGSIHFLLARGANLARRIVSGSSLVIAVFGLAVSDGRAALAAVIIALIGHRFLPKAVIRETPWLLVLSVPLFLGVTALIPESWLAAIARTGSASEIMSGNQRAEIWARAFAHFAENPLSLAFGYGAYGQASSGLSASYSFLFDIFESDWQLISVHNAGLQILTNVGLVGLAVYVWFYRSALGQFLFSRSRENAFDRAAIAVIFYVLLVGILDTFGTLASRESYYVITLLAAAALGVGEKRLPERRRRPALQQVSK